MTKLLEQAMEQLSKLPQDQQDQLAGFVLNELREDARWRESTENRLDSAKKLATPHSP